LSLSKPMQLFAIRLDADEKKRLEQLAAERHITLSYAMREGARQYLQEMSAKREPDMALLPRNRRAQT